MIERWLKSKESFSWLNEDGSDCPPFGVFEVTGWDNVSGRPEIKGRQVSGDEEDILIGINFHTKVKAGKPGRCIIGSSFLAKVADGVENKTLLKPAAGWQFVEPGEEESGSYQALGPPIDGVSLVTLKLGTATPGTGGGGDCDCGNLPIRNALQIGDHVIICNPDTGYALVEINDCPRQNASNVEDDDG